MVASASGDKTVRLWDAATGTALRTLEVHSSYVFSVAFFPDGKLVVSRSWKSMIDLHDTTMWLLDGATGAGLLTFNGPPYEVTSATFSPDGKVMDTLLLSDNWIEQGEEKIIWLHPDHRGELVASHKGTIVLAQSCGRIFIMRFKSGPKVV